MQCQRRPKVSDGGLPTSTEVSVRGHPTSPRSSEAKGSSSSSATLHNMQCLPLLGLFGQIQTDPTPGTCRHPPAEVGRDVWRWPGRYVLPVPGQGGMPSPEGTWRSQLRLAGGAGQGQALPEPVHPVEPQGQLCFRHGFQGFGRSEGEFGLIGQAGLGALGVSGAPRLEGERREVRGELRWVPQPRSAPLDAAMRCSCLSSGGWCWDGAARVRLSRIQGCSVLVPQLSQHTNVV